MNILLFLPAIMAAHFPRYSAFFSILPVSSVPSSSVKGSPPDRCLPQLDNLLHVAGIDSSWSAIQVSHCRSIHASSLSPSQISSISAFRQHSTAPSQTTSKSPRSSTAPRSGPSNPPNPLPNEVILSEMTSSHNISPPILDNLLPAPGLDSS
ncbi:hypothetical protein BKA61DRAFT_593358 [Leptodontidium sp. MPI-SDFR-AT-0119]|nr:hypothetical protein BKA61DRAFT_593358 [Leptodontidium sp. MPI-SDFR-AT-0119]